MWTNFFDEVAATALATAFRKSGVRVKLVGLVRGGATGASGLTLVPDVTLEQAIAIADRTTVVVIPGSLGAVRRLDNDPRVCELLSRAHTNHAVFVTSEDAAHEVAALVRGQDAPLAIEPYPADQGMIEFADRLAATMSSVSNARPVKRTDEHHPQVHTR
ncbi:MAG: DJ-1/PfpI family protein [Chloroflexi bacterium]|nr:DJ-1/PfpI family protein [Chloroflexota bacterium]